MAIINIHENLLPRRYQEEVFCRAQEGNIIAALDTGSGKTFISTLLIKWVACLESSQNKVIIFLVPKVTLVEQQGDFIARQTPLRVLKLHGCLDLDLTDRKGWKKRFENHDVFVMTAQIFINLLTHSHWSINKVSLMVFDECHHARKSHPYNGIMREYFQVPISQRPKVFAMTASPIWNTKDPEGSLTILESNMDAKVIGVREHLGELLDCAPKPTEVIKTYPPSPEVYPYPSPSLWDCLNSFYRWSDVNIPWSNIETKYNVTLDNLGPYCAELYLYNDLKRRIRQLIIQCMPDIQGDVEMDPDLMSIDIPSLPPEILEIQAILSDFQPFFEHISDPTRLPIPITLEWCSPKIKVLVDVLLAHHSSSFQGIIFVEQRQIAMCLARVLPYIPEIKDTIQTAELVGQGATDDGISKGMGLRNQHDAVKLFHEGTINLLISTSVAEEGLDFPACDIVVRFDPLQHMVGYVQCRGRARRKTSTFVIMVQEDDAVHLARYRAFLESEPELKQAYQLRREEQTFYADNELEEDEEEDLVDLAERQRYVVPSTGAILTYDNSINLLNYLCSLIPTDSFTPVHVPKYNGDFEAVLQLPISLPLPAPDLIYTGPRKHTKKEAKRAVAFLAVKRLHELNVFDDFLLPVSGGRGKGDEDADGKHISDVSGVPSVMDVMVRDPWTASGKLWVQTVHVDGRCVGGLITGTLFPPIEMLWNGFVVEIRGAEMVVFQAGEERRQREMMRAYTKNAIWYCITLRPLAFPPGLYLVPLNTANQPDFEVIQCLVDHPLGNYDWTGIGEDEYDRLMIMNANQTGRPLLLRRIRYDLTPMSTPIDGSREAGFPTYRDYFVQRWTGKKRIPHVPMDGPLVEAIRLPHQTWGTYSLNAVTVDDTKVAMASVSDGILVPQGCCRWIDLSEDIRRAYEVLPPLCHRITDLYRVRQARIELGLPAIADNLLVEAFTLPSANAPYNNQRLETLGDSVLKVCTTVHIFNKYPHRHEGQLDVLRQNSICNRNLLARAKEVGLEQFLIPEVQNVHDWRYTVPELEYGDDDMKRPERHALRQFPRRSLQDCMEATLGAAFLTGGIPMALRTGDALGLAFGGTRPWSLRYGRTPEGSSVPAFFETLQESLGYRFHESGLLVEAVTHPSFASSGGSSYQRLEFLGDALLDLVVIKYLYDKFPQATSEQLSLARSRAICSPALASVSVRRLGLHKIMLINNVELNVAISGYVPLLEALSSEDVVQNGWKYDPPKALSDVLESVLGAVLVDSAYNFEKAESIVEFVLGDVLAALSLSLRQDPVSQLIRWTASLGCKNVHFRNTSICPETGRNNGVAVLIHDILVAGPLTATSQTVAKGLVSEKALKILKDKYSDKCLSRLCDCGRGMEVDPVQVQPDEEKGDGEQMNY